MQAENTPLPILDCNDCGACCTHIGTPPGFAMFFGAWPQREIEQSPDWEIFRSMPAKLKTELRRYYHGVFVSKMIVDRTSIETPCLWYNEATRKCRNYEHRPTTCREFRVGCEGCMTHRARMGVI